MELQRTNQLSSILNIQRLTLSLDKILRLFNQLDEVSVKTFDLIKADKPSFSINIYQKVILNFPFY